MVLTRIANRCDEQCLVKEVRKNDPELSAILLELKSRNQKNFKARSRLSRFQQVFVDAIESDPVKREKTLRDLAREDKDNAYPMFFLAALIPDIREQEKKAILEEGLRRKNYESYYTDFRRRLKKATIHRPDAYARSFLFYGDLKYFPMNTSYLWSLEELDPELARRMALKIIKPTLDHKGKYSDLLWDKEDYEMSRYMLGKLDPTEDALHPEYDVGDLVSERYAPGLSDECSESAFMKGLEKTRLELRELQEK